MQLVLEKSLQISRKFSPILMQHVITVTELKSTASADTLFPTLMVRSLPMRGLGIFSTYLKSVNSICLSTLENTSFSVFTARRGLWSRNSVCLSVCHTCALWLIQRTYRRYFYTTWKGNPSSFLTPKTSEKFQRSHPQRGRQIEVG